MRFARFGDRCGGGEVQPGGLGGSRMLRSAQREGTRAAVGAGERRMRSAVFRSLLFVVVFELGHVSGDIVRRRPAHHQVAPHFLCAFRRLAARPERDQQAGDDRAVGLNLDPVPVVAEQVAAAEQMLELTKENRLSAIRVENSVL